MKKKVYITLFSLSICLLIGNFALRHIAISKFEDFIEKVKEKPLDESESSLSFEKIHYSGYFAWELDASLIDVKFVRDNKILTTEYKIPLVNIKIDFLTKNISMGMDKTFSAEITENGSKNTYTYKLKESPLLNITLQKLNPFDFKAEKSVIDYLIDNISYASYKMGEYEVNKLTENGYLKLYSAERSDATLRNRTTSDHKSLDFYFALSNLRYNKNIEEPYYKYLSKLGSNSFIVNGTLEKDFKSPNLVFVSSPGDVNSSDTEKKIHIEKLKLSSDDFFVEAEGDIVFIKNSHIPFLSLRTCIKNVKSLVDFSVGFQNDVFLNSELGKDSVLSRISVEEKNRYLKLFDFLAHKNDVCDAINLDISKTKGMKISSHNLQEVIMKYYEIAGEQEKLQKIQDSLKENAKK